MRINGGESPPAAPAPLLKMNIGKFTYLVGVHFNEDSKETMADKIDRMIRRDIRRDIQRGSCGANQASGIFGMKSP